MSPGGTIDIQQPSRLVIFFLLLVGAIVLGLVLLSARSQPVKAPTVLSARQAGDLRVEEAVSPPQVLDFRLQGTTPGTQRTQSGLQKSTNASNIQPSAKKPNLKDLLE